MTDRKYHYKTPGQINLEIESSHVKKKSSLKKGHLILILDLAIIMLVAGILYYNNLFIKSETVSKNTFTRQELEFSASVSANSSRNGLIKFYLHVKNNGKTRLPFPTDKEPYLIETILCGVTTEGVIVTEKILALKSDSINPGETTTYLLELPIPDKFNPPTRQITPRFQFALNGRTLVFDFSPIILP